MYGVRAGDLRNTPQNPAAAAAATAAALVRRRYADVTQSPTWLRYGTSPHGIPACFFTARRMCNARWNSKMSISFQAE